MNAERLRRKTEREKQAWDTARSVSVALLQNPAFSIPLAYTLIKSLHTAKVLSDVESGALMAVITSGALLSSFSPLKVGVSN